MKQYADYEFYEEKFCGNVIKEETLFQKLSIEASYFLDELTLGRITEEDEAIKLAVCAIAEIGFYEHKENSGDQIASETVGPHSVSYVKKSRTSEDYRKDKIRKARMYLSGTGLLYRGLSSCSL